MPATIHKEVFISIDQVNLGGESFVPQNAIAVAIFSHGSSSRFSKRNKEVAEYLQHKKIGTLLFDLLTPEEDRNYSNRFNIALLTKRLAGATEWLTTLPAANECRIGYFGASTGAASALRVAACLIKKRCRSIKRWQGGYGRKGCSGKSSSTHIADGA